MKKTNAFHDYVMDEVLAQISGITSRAMFGGYGIYKDGVVFAIIADDQLYFKVNETNKANYEHRDSEPFMYTMPNGKKMAMAYWLLPEEIMEDKRELERWVETSVAISKQTKGKKK